MEDAEVRRAACSAALHCQLVRPRAGNREIVVYEELAAGERDRLSFERWIELNRVSVASRSDRTAQRAETAVVSSGDRDRVTTRLERGCAKQSRANREYDSAVHSESRSNRLLRLAPGQVEQKSAQADPKHWVVTRELEGSF